MTVVWRKNKKKKNNKKLPKYGIVRRTRSEQRCVCDTAGEETNRIPVHGAWLVRFSGDPFATMRFVDDHCTKAPATRTALPADVSFTGYLIFSCFFFLPFLRLRIMGIANAMHRVVRCETSHYYCRTLDASVSVRFSERVPIFDSRGRQVVRFLRGTTRIEFVEFECYRRVPFSNPTQVFPSECPLLRPDTNVCGACDSTTWVYTWRR